MSRVRQLFTGLGLSIVALVIAAAPPQTSSLFAAETVLTPRVYLPLQLREWRSEPPLHSGFGVSDSLSFAIFWSSQALNLFMMVGMIFNRTSVNWSLIEPTDRTPDQYDWIYADNAILPLLNQNIEPFVLILKNPSWAASTNCGPVYAPDSLGEFVGALVARYPQVKYWGLYNEVDGAVFSIWQNSSGGCFGEEDLDGNHNPDYADYAELMRVAWKAKQQVNPNAQLVFGILAFDNFTPESHPPGYPGGCCFNYHFLDNLLSYIETHPLPEGERYADVFGFNNYLAYDLGYWEHHFPSVGVGSKILALREIMAKHNQDFPMVISEMSSWPTLPSVEGVPQETQARQLAQMYAESVFYSVKVLMWWPWSDYPDTNCKVPVPCEVFKYGVVTADQTPKLSYFALKTLVAELRGFKPTEAKINDKYVDLGFKKGKRRKHVVFARTDTFEDATVKLEFEAERIRVVEMLGKRSVRTAKENGKIPLTVTANPVYVEINP